MRGVQRTISGQRIVRLRTLGSFYDKGYIIEAYDDEGKMYRMDVNEFLKLLNDQTLEVRQPKQHEHLSIKVS